jgi:peptidoglycan-N-acetylglucosamine deacetylase
MGYQLRHLLLNSLNYKQQYFMKHIFRLLIVIVILMATQTVSSQVASPYQVGTWPEFKSCAVSYTFDDGCSGQFSKAIPIFNEVGYKLTLFTVSSWTSNWTNLQNAAKNGHEVANHTATHPNLSSMTAEAQESEIKTSNDLINSNVTSQKSLTMATPFCAEGNKKTCLKYFIAVRGCSGVVEPKTPANWNNVSSVICGTLGAVLKVKDFKSNADAAAKKNGWLVYLIHGIDNDGGYSPLASDTLKASLQYLKENDSKFWVNTFGNVARYIKERNCLSVVELSSTDDKISMEVTDTLSNNEIFNYPVSLRRPLPDGWTSATAKQNGDSIGVKLVSVNSVKYIQFEAVPDGGSIVLSKSDIESEITGTVMKSSLNNDFKIWVNNNELRFSIPELCGKNPSVSIFNLKGAKVISYNSISIFDGFGNIHIGTIQQPGIYLFQLTDNHFVWSKKIRLFSI